MSDRQRDRFDINPSAQACTQIQSGIGMRIMGPWRREAMGQRLCMVVEAADHERLVAIVSHRNRPRKRVEWVHVVLALG
jgi:hypothetical protein